LWGCHREVEAPAATQVHATADTASETTSAFSVLAGPTTGLPDGTEALLVGELRVTTDVPTHAFLVVEGPCGPQRVDFPGTATEHVLPVLGLHAASSHTVAVELDTGGVPTRFEAGVVVTEALVGLPPIEVLAHDPAAMEPGLLVFTLEQDLGRGWILALDEQLHVVYGLRRIVEDLRLYEGTWFAGSEDRVVRWDLFGRELQRWPTTGEGNLHHEAFPLPDGGVLSLEHTLLYVPDYPTDETLTDTAPTTVLTQIIQRFDADGNIVESISLGDLLDPQHVGYLSLGEYPDWTHANSVVPWGDDAYLVSVRHLDVVICVERSGTLRWMLGDPAGWQEPWRSLFLEPRGEVVWPRHAHALEVLPEGVVGMFDNGNHGGTPYAPAPEDYVEVSRGVAFRVDEAAMTVSTEWSVPHEGFFTHAMGDADRLAQTGNLLLTFARVPKPVVHPRIVQVHPERPDTPALDLRIGLDWRRWTYRAEVVPSLYGPGILETRTGAP
jgi:hypothetical protein